jgi:putative tricarboxylic transport membrane protein
MYISLVLVAFGLGVMAEAWRMPRFEHLGVNPYTVPGLVPAFIAAALVLFGLIMLLRSSRALAGSAPVTGGPGLLSGEGARRTLLTLLLTLGYGAGLVGLLPYWLATFLFVFLFITVFEWPTASSRARRARVLALALLQAALVAGLVTFIFERLFLVRLP